jgi:long-chain fatty acid transport protein
MKQNCILVGLSLLLSACVVSVCYPVGFYNPDQSVSAQAQADAVVARPQDASTLYYNPAGIVRLPTWQVTAGFHVILPEIDYVYPFGQKESLDDTFFVPHLYFSANPKNSRFAAGLGVSSPFGLGTDWGGDSFARYVAPYSKLDLLMINPNVAYQVTDSFSVAAGASLYTGDLTLDRFVPSAMLPGMLPPGMDLGTTIEVDGDAWGWNLAVLYDISEQVSFGASYRSKVDLDLSGSMTTNPPTPLTASSFLELHLPSTLKAGLAYKPTSELSIEVDIDWLEWSRFSSVEVSFFPPVLPSEVSLRDWDDAVLYSIGAEYALGRNWKARAGYGYAESPIPDATYEPGIPRNDLHVLSFGFGKAFDSLTLDLGCTFILSEEREVNSNVGEPMLSVDGNYDGFTTILGAGVSYSF